MEYTLRESSSMEGLDFKTFLFSTGKELIFHTTSLLLLILGRKYFHCVNKFFYFFMEILHYKNSFSDIFPIFYNNTISFFQFIIRVPTEVLQTRIFQSSTEVKTICTLF